jgi:regulator of protease activity HflC (stomatin/prohibitin superfamily)
VAEPGLSFIGKLERLDQVFDLRLQLRTREIDVASKDGIRFKARYFTAFRLDNENWTKETYDALRPLHPHLRGADKLSYTTGSFPYSHLRVQAAQGVTGTRVSENDPLIYWDQWVMNVIEDQTRQVISQKELDEMWRPANDSQFANAMDVIASEIKKNSESILRAAGILLFAARVVNFSFPTDGEKGDEIARQQIATWASEWEKRRRNILDTAEAESERVQQEARAYAESILLNSIAEGLQRTQAINDKLPRFVIAMRFLSALQEYVHKHPMEGEQAEEAKRKMAEFQKEFKTWQDLFYPGKE